MFQFVMVMIIADVFTAFISAVVDICTVVAAAAAAASPQRIIFSKWFS